MNRPHTIVIVSARSNVAEAVRMAVAERAALTVVASLRELLAPVRRRDVAAVVVDASALTTSPQAVLQSIRAEDALLPILFVSTSVDAELVNQTQLARVDLVCGVVPEQFGRFFERALCSGVLSAGRFQAYIDHVVATKRVNAVEREMLSIVLEREPESEVQARLGLEAAAFRRRFRRLCRKCDARTSDGALRNLLREALVTKDPRGPLRRSGLAA